MDAVELTRALIRCPSVTPEEGGALVLLEAALKEAGFATRRVDREGVPNLYARFGDAEPVLAFNGHTDVVPVGDEAAWTHPPFGAEVVDGKIFGRGACDMKSGVAAFVAAAIEFVQTPFDGSIVLLITGDEEGAARDGTLALLDDLAARGETLSHAIVGEPSCPNFMGEMIKVGRRGSFTAFIEAEGKQGHVAYPDRAHNPLPAMIALLDDLQNWQLDEGYENFQPSNLEVVSVDVGNSVTNVIPARVTAVANIRYNPAHSAASLQEDIDKRMARFSGETKITARYHASGDAFLTRKGDFTDKIAGIVEKVTGHVPSLSTSGGTSDARFIKDFCPVVEVGLVGSSMHQVDEFVEVHQITQLTEIYSEILQEYFAPRKTKS